MESKENLLEKLKLAKNTLLQKYPIKTLALFGSYARNEQTQGSDIDILVDFTQSVGIEFIELALDLDKIIGQKVDLLSKKAIQKSAKFPYIEKDLIYV